VVVAVLEGAFDDGEEVAAEIGFAAVGAGSDFGGLAGDDAGIVLADQDDLHLGDLATENAGCVEAVHAGHADVHEDDVGMGGMGLIDGLLAIGGFAADFPAGMAGEHGGDHAADACVVIDEQDLGLRHSWCEQGPCWG